MGGYCGNFNGDADDEFDLVRPSFHKPRGADLGPVASNDILFNVTSWEDWKSEGNENRSLQDPETVMRSCSTYLQDVAAERCKRVTDTRMKQDCVIDVCATGLAHIADGILAAEIIQMKVNARGIPAFMDHGECLDSVGRKYVGFGTRLSTAADCTDALRGLALTSGVIGAQLQSGGRCQVLVVDDADPTATYIKGGWGAKIDEMYLGQGLISNTTNDSKWKCWQLI